LPIKELIDSLLLGCAIRYFPELSTISILDFFYKTYSDLIVNE